MGLRGTNLFFIYIGVSINGVHPTTGWSISWKIPSFEMDDDWGYPMTQDVEVDLSRPCPKPPCLLPSATGATGAGTLGRALRISGACGGTRGTRLFWDGSIHPKNHERSWKSIEWDLNPRREHEIIEGKIYRKAWLLPLDMEGSCLWNWRTPGQSKSQAIC